jgi:hypothetical protein
MRLFLVQYIFLDYMYPVKKLFQLEQDKGAIIGHENLKIFITEYYKKLFWAPEPKYFSLVESQCD